MQTYALGDIQGCYDELQSLLELIHYNPDQDRLWFVGDLVNRGPKSLQTLRFIKNLTNAAIVLGNHDLHLLALYNRCDPLLKKHSLHEIIQAPDALELINWLRKQPMLHYDEKINCVMTHAGIYPKWGLNEAINYAKEVEHILRGKNYTDLLIHMYGNTPNRWQDNLSKYDRLRFIINSFTRMRFCNLNYELDFTTTGPENCAPEGYIAWYKLPDRKKFGPAIVFGHWAALKGNINMPNIFAMDSGCVWGGKLTAMRLEDKKIFNVKCHYCDKVF